MAALSTRATRTTVTASLRMRARSPGSITSSSLAMATSGARCPRLSLLLLVFLLATLSSPSVHASSERHHVAAPAPAAVVPGHAQAQQEFHVAPTTGRGRPSGGASEKGRERRSRARGGGTGAWTFSAMLPRGFVPPSGSSACHNDMPLPATAADAQFFACSGAETP